MPTCARTLFALFLLASAPALAAPECPLSVVPATAPADVVDWYDKYVAHSRTLAGVPDTPRPTRSQVEEFIEGVRTFHRRAVADSLLFEPLVQQIAAHHANAGDFLGLNARAAAKIYRAGSGPGLDFSALCIDTRRGRFPDDQYTITLFGVNFDNCRHVTVRGLVFTNTLINGNPNGECRPDHTFYRMLVVPVFAGTNHITFVCNKDVGGCAGR
jgi:hypothetical protein